MKEREYQSNYFAYILSFLGIFFNVVEQGSRLLHQTAILPDFFISVGDRKVVVLAAVLALIISALAVVISGVSMKPIDSRGWIIKRVNYLNDIFMSHVKFFCILSILLLSLFSIYISIGLNWLRGFPIYLQLSLQLISYSSFWGIITYVSAVYLREYQDIKKFQEQRIYYTLILQETIEKYNAIISDKRLSIKASYDWYGNRLNIIKEGKDSNNYYLIVTSYDGSQLLYSQELDKETLADLYTFIKEKLKIELGKVGKEEI